MRRHLLILFALTCCDSSDGGESSPEVEGGQVVEMHLQEEGTWLVRKVLPGETLASLLEKLPCSESELRASNPDLGDEVVGGQVLRVPFGSGPCPLETAPRLDQ